MSFGWFLLFTPLLLLHSSSSSPVRAVGALGGLAGGANGIARDDFPESFVFGSGTSAYQVEGAADEDGRTPSVWDTFAHSGYTSGNGDIASDGYHKYKGDVRLMKELGLEAYRFSISWPRLIPNGRGQVNPKAREFYNNLINELLRHGIVPHVTLFHYDHPQALEDEYGGWLSTRIIEDFTAYADACFKEFGDRVLHWTTLNEPNVLALGGYDYGIFPPGRCSRPFGSNCTAGDSTIEPYIVSHHCLLAHSSVVSLYRRKYQSKQRGFIGINIFMYNMLPFSSSAEDVAATKRAYDFSVGWYLDALYNGDYPKSMRESTGGKLPKFSSDQSQQLKGSFDFIGLNYYVTLYVKDNPNDQPPCARDFYGDAAFSLGVKGSSLSDKEHAKQEDYALQAVLEYFKQYGNPPVYIHENGYPMPQRVIFADEPRVDYMIKQFKNILNALRNGTNTLGYFTWSFVDVFELLQDGTTYGLCYVDFNAKDLNRIPRLSALWYASFLARNLSAVAASSAF